MTAKKSSAKIPASPIPGFDASHVANSIPNNLRLDVRVFAGFTGGNAGATQTFHTVPPGRIWTIKSMIKVDDQFVTDTGSYLTIFNAGGAKILKKYTTGTGPDSFNSLSSDLKLLEGDYIEVFYHTSDTSGRFLWFLQGIEEANLTSYGL